MRQKLDVHRKRVRAAGERGKGKGGGMYSSRFWVGVCRPDLQMSTLFYIGFPIEQEK